MNGYMKTKIEGGSVVNTISIATGKFWHDIFNDLVEYSHVIGDKPDARRVYESYLDEHFERIDDIRVKGNLISVRKFCKSHPTGSYVIRTALHIAAVVDGVYYDYDNFSNHNLYCAWRV